MSQKVKEGETKLQGNEKYGREAFGENERGQALNCDNETDVYQTEIH